MIMKRDQWYIVLESVEVRGKPVGVTRMGEKLVFWRDLGGKVICLADPCIHRGAALSYGQCVGGHLQCPFHGLEFDSTGRCVLIPANGAAKQVPENFMAPRYPTFEGHGFIWIFYGDSDPEELKPEFFTGLEKHSRITQIDPWSAHYSRCVENQLDVAHLPFVHRKTIGRGRRTVADGPRLTWLHPGRFRVDVYNRHDNGQPARFPQDTPVKPQDTQHLDFIFPNLWQNYLSNKLRIVVAFVPVDGENTLLYLRLYQKMVTLPVISQLFNWIFMPFNLRILHEDRRVVQTQVPKASSLNGGENLFPADMPIVQFRRKRDEHTNADVKN
jgi:phenylpropionate dioxygenase-like ring-hydroxylating dioxygenase large terminal subunit